MKNIYVPIVIDGIETEREETVYNIHDLPYNEILLKSDTVRKKGKGGISYINYPATFDIETSLINGGEPSAFMYHWQFCLMGYVVFGRTWDDFIKLLDYLGEKLELDENKRLVIYVHNLAYEFMFLKDFVSVFGIFAKAAHKVIKFNVQTINKYINAVNSYNVSRETIPTFEFRCSYFLSNMSLNKFCENSRLCTHYKLKADKYDYKKMRTPETKLEQYEEGYCYNDVKGLEECILSKMQDYGDTIASIPLTSTGYVRRAMRQAVSNDNNYRTLFKSLTLISEQYMLLRKVFRGGNTHASRYYANAVLNNVYSRDIASSYPNQIAVGKYPITPFIKFDPVDESELFTICNKKCVIMELTFFKLNLRDGVPAPYMDFGHATHFSNDYTNDNGRVIYADWITYACTEIDFKIICNQYTYDKIQWVCGFACDKGYLPDAIVNGMLVYYDKKTELKNVVGKEYEYMKSKNELNAIFGMMVSDIVHGEIIYDRDDDRIWYEIKPDINEALERYFNSRNNFLPYQWGVYVTANARNELQTMIDAVSTDFVYCDTDSIKFLNHKNERLFEDRNNYLLGLEHNHRNYSERINEDGTIDRYYLGIWEQDGEYLKFKTLGAKKYAYVSKDKGKKAKLHITVAGLSKIKGAQELNRGNGIDDFNIGKVFEDSGRTTSYFNESDIQYITVTDYNGKISTFKTASNIAIVDTTYTLGVSDEYAEILGLTIDTFNPYK